MPKLSLPNVITSISLELGGFLSISKESIDFILILFGLTVTSILIS